MSKNLVIVESPAKGKTIERYLGKDYKVLASYGHVRDLESRDGAVDPDRDFHMRYELIERNEKHVNAIRRELKRADTLLLATDPDREGEAISWHLVEYLREQGDLEGKDVRRVVFHEITKGAVQEAIEHPRELGTDLVNAQQARRALDHLVGFNLSPLLWRKIRPKLSAGRVQTPALRLICERESEIDAFVPREYWNVAAALQKDSQPFNARLSLLDGDKVEQFTIDNGDLAGSTRERLLAAAGGVLVASKVDRKQVKRNASAPFTTSTLQQEASRKLGFGTQRTMRVAQKLYEGVDIGDGQTGLITYMRTDSITLSRECLDELRELIPARYGRDFLPDTVNVYKNKSKNAQEAHEAIRPTSAHRTPDEMRKFLDDDQYKLYNLVWKRTVASQMIHATLDQVSIDLDCGSPRDQFRASGSTVRHPGFMKVYREDEDDRRKGDDDEKRLPNVEEGDRIPLDDIAITQHFTQPPPRYTEASLVKKLEELGIGRPSTYASIISTLQAREYVELESRRFTPTDMGRIVSDFLTRHFDYYVDYAFTARLEDELDAVSRGEQDWIPLLGEFWKPFHERVEDKMENVTREEAVQSRELGIDPESGKPVTVRMGRYGPMVQIGTRDDEEKPRFAGLQPGQKMGRITLEEALRLFDLPRDLGETPEGEPLTANIGRFGPYVKYGSKFASLKEDDPYTITPERAREVVAAKKEADANRLIRHFEGTNVQILNGRWGPYITDGSKNARIPKEQKETPQALDLDTCLKLLEEAPERKGRGKKKAAANAEAEAKPKKKASTRKKASAKKSGTKKATAKKAGTKKAAAKKKAAGRPTAEERSAVASAHSSAERSTDTTDDTPTGGTSSTDSAIGDPDDGSGIRKIALPSGSR